MGTLLTVLPMIIVLALLVFWMWMFWDMTNNERLPRWTYWDVGNGDNLASRRLNWMTAFLFLNVFAAGIYYATVYKNKY